MDTLERLRIKAEQARIAYDNEFARVRAIRVPQLVAELAALNPTREELKPLFVFIKPKRYRQQPQTTV